MKTSLIYGFAMAFFGALLNLVLYLLGYHSDLAKFGSARVIGTVVGLASAVICIVLGLRARRAELPPTEEFGYGRALGTGVMISLFAALFSTVTNYLYMSVINPGFTDLVMQAELQKMEAKGMSAAKIEQVETGMRMFMTPAVQSVFAFVFVFLFCVLISLVVAAFLKRSADDAPPLVA